MEMGNKLETNWKNISEFYSLMMIYCLVWDLYFWNRMIYKCDVQI